MLACLDAIAAGEVYQACVCTQFVGQVSGAPVDFFADAVARTAPARAAFVAGDWGAVASLSPELFLRRVGDAVDSSPIKGTLPIDEAPSALRASVKDVAENIMIVDLVRNDLGRVAVTGSVTVPELLAVRPAPGVWHLVSTVSARVDTDVPMSAVLDATFPPASVTGTPKTRARELLAEMGAGAARNLLRNGRFGVARRGHRAERGDPHRRVRRHRPRGARRRRRHHRRFRSGRGVAGVPAQGGADDRPRTGQRRIPAHSRAQLPDAIFSRSSSLSAASSRNFLASPPSVGTYG